MFGFSYSLDNITICQVVGNGFDPSSLRALGSTGLVSSLAGLSWSGSLGPVESIPWGWGSVLPGLPGPVPHNLGVDGAEDAEISLTAAASTMFLMTNFLIALSLGQALEQFVHLMYLTCPRPCLLRPPLRLLKGIFSLVEVNQAILAW